ncbi:MAG TPA: hypothetical protein VII95_10235 [Terriglobales bacterium]
MEFHLLYTGPLHSAGSENHVAEGHSMRKVFHRQLQRLWNTHPNLREMAVSKASDFVADEANKGNFDVPSPSSRDEAIRLSLRAMGNTWNGFGFNFIPLVTADLCLRCSLDILFLRVEEKNYVLQGGDIDRRLITLFDSLRIAKERNQFPRGTVPDAGEDPFFCLLQDDKLISEVRVNTGQLLRLPEARALSKHDVYLQITVKLNTTRPHQYAWVF